MLLRRVAVWVVIVRDELRQGLSMSWLRRLSMWTRGFKAQSRVIYPALRRGDAYISDWERSVYTPLINGPYKIVLNDKLLFHYLLGDLAPRLLGTLTAGRFFPSDAGHDAPTSLLEQLRRSGVLVIKGRDGGGGKSFRRVQWLEDAAVAVNGERMSSDDFAAMARGMDGALVTDCVEQAAYARRIYAPTTNTLRVLTLWDPRMTRPHIAAAVHRFGTSRSFPVDNWCKGGVCAPVDLQTGRMGRAVAAPRDARNGCVWHETHPDSGEMIAGLEIPGWQAMSQALRQIIEQRPFLRYVGWDVVITDDGFKILEGNNCPDVDLMQVHGPLLADEKSRRFFEWYGVRRRSRGPCPLPGLPAAHGT